MNRLSLQKEEFKTFGYIIDRYSNILHLSLNYRSLFFLPGSINRRMVYYGGTGIQGVFSLYNPLLS